MGLECTSLGRSGIQITTDYYVCAEDRTALCFASASDVAVVQDLSVTMVERCTLERYNMDQPSFNSPRRLPRASDVAQYHVLRIIQRAYLSLLEAGVIKLSCSMIYHYMILVPSPGIPRLCTP
ncbi:hypothetical protein M404DRAFT_316428 [Pisolithus tinctorius Marx 270]|uniref:Uncharacterized protein n=1 Tax=Pisolithus tinctorius Marx 270 TaxID=870435 RepID=A0A0C3JCJ1_PISTI|nr:hypothetical protein M404DRAFT_316428 [Pisolithus tinctorius Marx 270]